MKLFSIFIWVNSQHPIKYLDVLYLSIKFEKFRIVNKIKFSLKLSIYYENQSFPQFFVFNYKIYSVYLIIFAYILVFISYKFYWFLKKRSGVPNNRPCIFIKNVSNILNHYKFKLPIDFSILFHSFPS